MSKSSSASIEPGHRSPASLRTVLFGLVLILINNYWITLIEVRYYSLDGSCLPLFITPIFILFLVTLFNLLVKRLKPSLAMSPGELITLYILVVIGASMAAHDMVQNLFGVIAHPAHFKPMNPTWDTWYKYLPPHLFVDDPLAVKALYNGNADPNNPKLFMPFIAPLALWSILVFALVGIALSMNLLVRRLWSEQEKLTFPLIQLPMAMCAGIDGQSLYKMPLLWAGFALAATISGINGLHDFIPNVPYLTFVKGLKMQDFTQSPPWNVIADTQFNMYPFAIGLAFFTPLDLGFSCWFFYIARRLFQVWGVTQGFASGQSTFPWFIEQGSGAWMAMGIGLAFAARHAIRDSWRIAWRGAGSNREEVGQYRTAFITFLVCCIVIGLFAKMAGFGAGIATAFFGIYLILALAITRVRAELGTPHEIYFVHPQDIMGTFIGKSNFKEQDLTAMSSFYWFNRGYRAHPMPNQLEAMKMFERVGGMSTLIWLILLATVVGYVSACWANLHVTFIYGGTAKAAIGFKSWVGGESYNKLNNWISISQPWRMDSNVAMAVGAAIVGVLRLARTALPWWPLHPAGYALAVSFAMDYFWFSFLIAWVIKGSMIQIGGMKLYKKAVPFFLGLVLGDYTVGCILAILGPMTGVSLYKIFI
ncbi:MAG: DUF6785 family protein [Armatimonadota bacterium]